MKTCHFYRIAQCSSINSMTLSSISMTFPWPLLFSMTFQAWKMVFLKSMTFHDQGAPWLLLSLKFALIVSLQHHSVLSANHILAHNLFLCSPRSTCLSDKQSHKQTVLITIYCTIASLACSVTTSNYCNLSPKTFQQSHKRTSNWVWTNMQKYTVVFTNFSALQNVILL